MEQIQAIMQAAHEANNPVICKPLVALVSMLGKLPPPSDFGSSGNLPPYPHCHAPGSWQQPSHLLLGNSSWFHQCNDGWLFGSRCKTPASYEYNVEVTAEWWKLLMPLASAWKENWAAWVLWRLVWAIRKMVTGRKAFSPDQLLTDQTKLTSWSKPRWMLWLLRLAPAMALKFTRKGEILAISRIEIHSRLPNTHLVMHGSSSVPEDLLAIINKYGGTIPETYGVPVEEIKGIKCGVRKVNIDTDNRLAITAAVREALAQDTRI